MAETVDVEQGRSFYATRATRVKYLNMNILDQGTKLTVDFQTEDPEDFRSDKIC
jgi:hypothetical protein